MSGQYRRIVSRRRTLKSASPYINLSSWIHGDTETAILNQISYDAQVKRRQDELAEEEARNNNRGNQDGNQPPRVDIQMQPSDGDKAAELEAARLLAKTFEEQAQKTKGELDALLSELKKRKEHSEKKRAEKEVERERKAKEKELRKDLKNKKEALKKLEIAKAKISYDDEEILEDAQNPNENESTSEKELSDEEVQKNSPRKEPLFYEVQEEQDGSPESPYEIPKVKNLHPKPKDIPKKPEPESVIQKVYRSMAIWQPK